MKDFCVNYPTPLIALMTPFSWGKNCHPVFKEGSIQPSYGENFFCEMECWLFFSYDRVNEEKVTGMAFQMFALSGKRRLLYS